MDLQLKRMGSNMEDSENELSRSIKSGKIIGSGTQYWYGRVNYWTESESLLSKEVKYMKKYGVTGYIIEMASWRSLNGDIRKITIFI